MRIADRNLETTAKNATIVKNCEDFCVFYNFPIEVTPNL